MKLNHRGFDMGELKLSSFKEDSLGIDSLVNKYQKKKKEGFKNVAGAQVYTHGK